MELKNNITYIFSKIYNLFFSSLNIKGKENTIKCAYTFLYNTKIVVNGSYNNIIFSPNTVLRNCDIKIYGNNNAIIIGSNSRIKNTKIHCEDNFGVINIGCNFTMEGGLIASGEDNNKISIGEDCMFSENVQLRNTDSHWIVCKETNKILNKGKKILIGDHVWIGANSIILKGVKVKRESVVGIGSIITKDIEKNKVICGANRIVKNNITWLRERI